MRRGLSVLYLVEGFTDIRFVVGLSEICDLTMAVPAAHYQASGLKARVASSGAKLAVDEIPGGRLAFQVRSLGYLWRRAGDFDVLLAQEMLRGALSANLVGRLKRVPVVTYIGIAPVEYFRCRRARGQIGWARAALGEALIRTLMTINGRLATRCLGIGPYLVEVAKRYSPRTGTSLHHGVDTSFFRPATKEERLELRQRHGLPPDKFIVFLSSRISHEKDPETVLAAVAQARAQGLDAILLNLGGGYREFLALAKQMALPDVDRWVTGRPAAHPMTEVADFFRCADAVALASLAEGAAVSTLEALACATPVVATDIGGMAVQLRGLARLTPLRDAQAMARELLWIAGHPEEARSQAMLGRRYVQEQWDRQKAFAHLLGLLESVCQDFRQPRADTA
jgi:glycosyltransferase involved in cell wall biosynthesis